MTKDRQVLVRLTDHQADALENFADDRGYNNAEAARKILESRLTSEGYLSQELYGPDSQESTEENMTTGTANQSGTLAMVLAAGTMITAFGLWYGTGFNSTFYATLFASLLSAFLIFAVGGTIGVIRNE